MAGCNGMSQSSTTASKFRELSVSEKIWVDDNGRVYYRDANIYTSSDNDGDYDIHADVFIHLNQNASMAASFQFDARADGVRTKYNHGAVSDAIFTNDNDGLIAIDSKNGRIYYRYGGGWHYSSQDAGFSWPEKTCHLCDKPFKKGDVVKMVVDGFASDGAPHALPVHSDCEVYIE